MGTMMPRTQHHGFFFLLVLWFAMMGTGFVVNAFAPLEVQQQATQVTTRTTKLFSIPNSLDVLTSGFASIFRFPGGVTAEGNNSAQVTLKQYFCIENDRSCRKVSERITELDLCVEAVVPASPKSRAVLATTTESSSTRYAAGIKNQEEDEDEYKFALPRAGLKAPVLVVEQDVPTEEGTKKELRILQGEEEIMKFFDETFDPNQDREELVNDQQQDENPLVGSFLKLAGFVADQVGNTLASAMRPGRGAEVSPSAGPLALRPSKPLILYDYAGNQFSRLVREVLHELDLVYELRSVGKESPRRLEMQKTIGSTQCPHLVDPNTGVSMNESTDIIEYLYDTYALYTPPNELLEWASEKILAPVKPWFADLAKLQAGSPSTSSGNKKSKNVPRSRADAAMEKAKAVIDYEIASHPVVVYTYEWSPFSSEAIKLLKRNGIPFREISLGREWLPGLISRRGGAEKRAALLNKTGQSSLPHIFVGGKSLGGLFTGTPGLIPSLANGDLTERVVRATNPPLPSGPISLPTPTAEADSLPPRPPELPMPVPALQERQLFFMA